LRPPLRPNATAAGFLRARLSCVDVFAIVENIRERSGNVKHLLP
jgi:hypothetical protein